MIGAPWSWTVFRSLQMPLADALKSLSGLSPSLPSDGLERDRVLRDGFQAVMREVLVDQPVFHAFAGAIESELANAIWTWIARDVAASPVARLGDDLASGTEAAEAFDRAMPELFSTLKANDAAEKADFDLLGRNTIQMGGQEARQRLPLVITALRRRPLLAQAARFGAAANLMDDDAALAGALQSITITNPVTRALWMQVMVGHMGNPGRALAAVVSMAGGASQSHVTAMGYDGLVEAMLCHGQIQIGRLAGTTSTFSDIDTACRAIERFHRLMRALTYTLDIERRSRWGKIAADLVSRMSERLERPLQMVNGHITQALRRRREGADVMDTAAVLEALNGLYMLVAARRARDSLAVNAVLDKAWGETGQTLEVLLTRALDAYRAAPGEMVARERLDAGIKMAEIRFNTEYAEILRRARDAAGRRAAGS